VIELAVPRYVRLGWPDSEERPVDDVVSSIPMSGLGGGDADSLPGGDDVKPLVWRADSRVEGIRWLKPLAFDDALSGKTNERQRSDDVIVDWLVWGIGKRVERRQRYDPRLGSEGARVELVEPWEGRPHNGDLGVSSKQPNGRIAERDGNHMDLPARKCFSKSFANRRNELTAQGNACPERNDVLLGATDGSGCVNRSVPGAQHGLCFGLQCETGTGEGHGSSITLQQTNAEVGFKSGDLSAERWLGDEQSLGGPPEVQLVGDGEEVLDVAEVDPLGHSNSLSQEVLDADGRPVAHCQQPARTGRDR
jgi:hypothetical protein